jgi:hypothetical protein
MPGYTKLQRVSRIKRRAIPAVVAAFEAGKISAKRADLLLYLSKDEQAVELERRLALAHDVERKHRLVASVIKTYLDNLNGRSVDLHQLGGLIRQALST